MGLTYCGQNKTLAHCTWRLKTHLANKERLTDICRLNCRTCTHSHTISQISGTTTFSTQNFSENIRNLVDLFQNTTMFGKSRMFVRSSIRVFQVSIHSPRGR